MSPRRLATVVALSALALGVGACGNKEDVVTHADTEGIYVDVGPLKYQVQNSRLLNPRAVPEDASFVRGVAGAQTARDEGCDS